MTDVSPQILAASKAAKTLVVLGALVKDKRTWAFLATVSAAAGYHLSPELAQALGALVDALATS